MIAGHHRRSGSERVRPRRSIVQRSETLAKPWKQGVCHGVLLKKSRKRTRQSHTFPKSIGARRGQRTLFELCSGIWPRGRGVGARARFLRFSRAHSPRQRALRFLLVFVFVFVFVFV